MAGKKNDTIVRRVQIYPSSLTKRYLKGWVIFNETTESSAASDIIKNFFEKMPPSEKERLLSYAKTGGKNTY
ncbi:MAG: hypothetical protein ACTHMC_01510 [Pseudobacter sp.]|uniref:hypothetical protein n=1 Tax=Pseudobacter sp. TaxID=2045420 RepID=UPI003F7D4790